MFEKFSTLHSRRLLILVHVIVVVELGNVLSSTLFRAFVCNKRDLSEEIM